MFNILKGGSKGAATPLSFSAEDIKSIVETFRIEDEANKPGLIALRSGDGVTTHDHVIRRIRELTAQDDHVKLEDLAQSLDVTVNIIRVCQKHIETTLLSQDDQQLRSRNAVFDVAQALHDGAVAGYVDQDEFLRQHDIHHSEIKRLLNVSASWIKNESDRQSLASPCIRRYAGREYITTSSVDAVVRSQIVDLLIGSANSGQSTSLELAQFPGLSIHALEDLATSCLAQLKDSRGQLYQGRFLLQEAVQSPGSGQCLRFIPDAEDNRRLTSAALSFFDSADFTRLGDWIERHSVVPDLLSSLPDALKFVQTELRDDTGEKIDVLVENPANGSLQDAMVTNCRALDGTADGIWRQNKNSDFIDIAPYVNTFATKVDVKDYLMDRVTKLAKSNRSPGDRGSWETMGTFIYTSHFYSQFLTQVGLLVKTVAEQKWMQMEEKPASQLRLQKSDMTNNDTLNSSFLAWIIENRLQQWDTWQHDFTHHIESLSELAFAETWRNRLSARCQLYSTGLRALSDGPLKDQLADLLRDHIIKELFPQTVQRATERARGFVTDKTPKRLAKLGSKLNDVTSLDACTSQMTKFEEKNSLVIEPLSVEELQVKQNSEVSVLYKITTSDKDAARRFLCAVLILLALRSKGVLYATGKSAPKLLKTLANDLDVNEHKTMERFKDEAKKGSVSEETFADVDAIVQAAMQRMGIVG